MYLKQFNRRSEYTCFDPSDDSVSEFQEIEDEATSGFCKNIDNRWIAVYPDADGESLIVHID
ncbi:hypothetical protein C499_10474 [Halogeometricum borinquense DSM 11551]|uniref:Uncharacterized protein n=1 Tax=Halogeometricum borinquense (strain ATCC 700274 / DSM 11551 / JCM 10706 / KCTC 4070 / PR3) TaxID=469382 RepID=E4NLC5_HALBP|nr:hypothetical protein Hbor_04170 [Halogeometricum borinquense DSM 11551]ELY27482.1 hypothetical protein C499_10474 [Halogeometricum borinquense DSM 11551]